MAFSSRRLRAFVKLIEKGARANVNSDFLRHTDVRNAA
jgi:hypothetical protein